MTKKSLPQQQIQIDEDSSGSSGEMHGVIDVKTVLVKYRDGFGTEATKLAIIIPNGDVYFFQNGSIEPRPVQKWLKSKILERVSKGAKND